MYKHLSEKGKNWIHKSIEDCMTYAKYHVGMFFNSEELKNTFADSIEILIGNNNIEWINRHNPIVITIHLVNGSTVSLFNASNLPAAIGIRYNCIIYDIAIDGRYERAIKSMVAPYGRDGEILFEYKLYEIEFK